MLKRSGALIIMTVFFLSGCVAVPLLIGAGVGGAGVYWYKGKLEETVPYTVSRVHRATVAGLKSLDIKITQNQADKLTMKVQGRLADGKKVWIDAKSEGGNSTKLTIRVGAMGDKEYSKRIRDAIVKRL
jgi:hypothetical protein